MSSTKKNLGLLVLRVAAGTIAAGHGYTKLFGGKDKEAPKPMTDLYGKNFPEAVESGGPKAFAGVLKHLQVPLPLQASYAAGWGEFAGGVGIALGFGTRLSGLALAGTMIGAYRTAHKDVGLYGQGGGELAVLLGAAAAALALTGPGAISLDALFGSADNDEA